MTTPLIRNLAEHSPVSVPTRGPMTREPSKSTTIHNAGSSYNDGFDRASPERLRDKGECKTLRSLFETRSFRRHFQPNSTILLHGERADAMYMVESGTVRCCTIDNTGRRQIFSFAKKRDFVGISDDAHWHFTAEAVDQVILRSIPRATVEQALAVNIPLRQEIRSRVRDLLERRERLLLLLVSAKAPERLFHFLNEFAGSRSTTDYITLPMPRRDIADHLGLSVETVSRAFSHLKSKRLIDLATHEKYKILACDGMNPPKALPVFA